MTLGTRPALPGLRSALRPEVVTQIIGLGTAVPRRFSQAEALTFVLAHFNVRERTRELYRRTFTHPSVQQRHFALDRLEEVLERDHDRINHRFEREAVRLSALALQAAADGAGLSMAQIDYVAVATCTGYLCPGISSFLIEAAGLRPNIRHADVVGMGCGAAIPTLEGAYDFVTTHPGATAAVVCTEICSAAFFSNDHPDIVISNTLFADGSAAILLRSSAVETALTSNGVLHPEIIGFESLIVPEWREKIRFRTEGGHLRNVLAKDLPEKAAEAFESMSAVLLKRHGLARDMVDHWILHPGGARVLEAFQERLKFRDDEIISSRAVLREHGNMSSPSVLFVLAEELRRRRPAAGTWGVLSAFGAGFSAYACLVRF